MNSYDKDGVRLPSKNKLNRALEKMGINERVIQGRGYVYFVEGEAHTWSSSSIPVCFMRDLDVESVFWNWKDLSGNDKPTFVCVGPNAWGKSTVSKEEAFKIMKANMPGRGYLGSNAHPYRITKVDGEFIGVDNMFGAINYRGRLEVVEEGTVKARR